MSFIFLPNAYQNILPFLFLFHTTVSSLIFIALLANCPSLTKVHDFSYLISMKEARSYEHGVSCVSCLTLRLWHASCEESRVYFSWIWQDIQQHRAHRSLAWAVVSCFTIKLVPWFYPSCFQILDCLRRRCLHHAYHFFFNRKRDSPGWMWSKSYAVKNISLSCGSVFSVPWHSPQASLTTFNPRIHKVIAPETGSPVSGELGTPSLKMQWEVSNN